MKFRDKKHLIRKNIKKNKSRTFMTVLASAMGCCFLIVLASFGFGIQKEVVDRIAEDRMLNQIQVYNKEAANDEEVEYAGLTINHIGELEAVDGVKTVTREIALGQMPTISFDIYENRALVNAAHFPSLEESGFKLYAGRMPKEDHEVIVAYHFLDSFQKRESELSQDSGEEEISSNLQTEELLGQEINMGVSQYFDEEEKVKNISLQVVGIAASPSREWQQESRVIISEEVLTQIEQFTRTLAGRVLEPDLPEEIKEIWEGQYLEGIHFYQQVNVYTHQAQDSPAVIKQLRDNGYRVYSVMESIDEANLYFSIFKIGLVLVGAIAIIIASIGIYNTMTMAVTERYQEIGIMKAIGSHPKTIKSIFLLESSYIGLIGTLIGITAGYAVSYGVNFALPFVFETVLNETLPDGFRFSYIPIGLTIISAAICVGISVISGLRPAVKATKVDVLQALRRDL